MTMNLIDRIEEAMRDDDADRDEQSAYLLNCYRLASEAERKVLDDAFTSLCGWGLTTLIKEYENA